MTINKVIDKFTYYDTLSNMVPGFIFIWSLSALGPFDEFSINLTFTGNIVVDSIMVISLAYIIGHVLQFISKITIEPLIKILFWKGRFLSEIFLIKTFHKCPIEELDLYLSCAENKFDFPKEKLLVLKDNEILSNESKRNEAFNLSQMIYRKIDAKTHNIGIAQKAHLQNTFYSLFRNTSTLFLLLGILDLIIIFLNCVHIGDRIVLLAILNFGLMLLFMLQAKQRGEYYVKGLFWSCI